MSVWLNDRACVRACVFTTINSWRISQVFGRKTLFVHNLRLHSMRCSKSKTRQNGFTKDVIFDLDLELIPERFIQWICKVICGIDLNSKRTEIKMSWKSNENASCRCSKSVWRALLPFLCHTKWRLYLITSGFEFFFVCLTMLQCNFSHKWESHQNDKFYMKVNTSTSHSIDVIWWNRTNCFSVSWKFPNERIERLSASKWFPCHHNFHWNWVRNPNGKTPAHRQCIGEFVFACENYTSQRVCRGW